ncbi:RICIN domain-containing protein [Paenibacillus allorhizoplanae]|nr:RICIN domain-containing protein [Paenibacillus allorhizoplanae]
MLCIFTFAFSPLLLGGGATSAAATSVINDWNLALGKSASADSEEASNGNVATNGNDGNLLSRWTANNGAVDHWWKVDLGSAQPLTGTEVKWEHSNIYKYKIDVSSDNVTWNTVADQTANTVSNQTNHDNFAANGRYVRITITGLVANEWASFYEFKVFGQDTLDAPDTSAYYKIKNSNSGKLMDIGGGSVSNGAADIQWSDNKGVNQQWQFTATGDGFYKIMNRKSGKLLQVSNSSTSNGAAVVQWDDNGSSSQQWKLTSLGKGIWKLENRNSGKAASVGGASTADGGEVIQWAYNGGAEQQWELITPTPMAYTAAVDPNLQYQKWEGWGTSLAWFANRIGGAPDTVRNTFADQLFSENGLNMNIVRYNIGGGENPAYPNWPTELRARIPGFQPTQGTYDWTADANQRWVLQAAKSRIASSEFLAEAFSNSPPWWMTKSGSVTGYQDGADNNLRDDMYDAFADYLVTVNQHFKEHWGVTFRTLTGLNEPSSWWNFGNRQEGSRFDPPYQERIIQKVAAKLQQQGSSTTVSASDETSIDMGRDTINSFSEATKSVISQYNVHTYGGSDRVGFNQAAAGKKIWMSEHGDGDATGLAMSRSIIEDLRYMKASGWAYWQAVDSFGWGMLDVNDLNDPNSTFTTVVNKKYWAMAQFSKYIRPGYTIIDIQDENSIAAYDQVSKKLVIVTLNDREAANTVTYNLSAFSPLTGSLTGTRTVVSTSENLAPISGLSLSNNTFHYTLPEGSMATFVISDAQVEMPVTGVQLDKPQVSLQEGQHAELIATVLPENATNKNVTWSSSDETIAKVEVKDGKAVVTALKEGKSDITVTTVDGNFTAVSKITVQKDDGTQNASATLSAASTVQTGGEIPVLLGLDSVTQNVYAQSIKMDYDSNVFDFISATAVKDEILLVDTVKDTLGKLQFIMANVGKALTGYAEVLELKFKAKAVTQPATGSIAVTDATLADGQGAEMKAQVSSVNVSITTPPPGIPGDVNHDNKISIGDLGIIAANYGKTSSSPHWEQIKHADVTGDGNIDIEDLTLVASKIME